MISIIICSIDDQKFGRMSAQYERLLAGEPFEIIRISDATGLAEGYNRGVARSRGDVLIFSHDDIEILNDDFRERLIGHLQHADVLGVAGAARAWSGRWIAAGPPFLYGQVVQPNPDDGMFDVAIYGTPSRRVDGIKILDGLFMVARRPVVQAVSFDQQTFNRFHLYDVDFTLRAFQAGFRLAVCCDIWLAHRSYGSFDEEWSRYERLFCQKHAATLDKMVPRAFRVTAIRVRDRAQLPEVLTPPHFGA